MRWQMVNMVGARCTYLLIEGTVENAVGVEDAAGAGERGERESAHVPDLLLSHGFIAGPDCHFARERAATVSYNAFLRSK